MGKTLGPSGPGASEVRTVHSDRDGEHAVTRGPGGRCGGDINLGVVSIRWHCNP